MPEEISMSKPTAKEPQPARPIGQEDPGGGMERPPGGKAIGMERTQPGSEIGPSGLTPTTGGRAIRSGAGVPQPGRPIESEPEFGLPGASIQSPGAFFAGSPVLGPASIFNIGGAPIAVLGGVFGGGLPIGGPVGQIFRSGAPIPNTLYISTLSPSGPIGTFFLGQGGVPIMVGLLPATGPLPIGPGFGEGGAVIFGTGVPESGGRPIGGGGL